MRSDCIARCFHSARNRRHKVTLSAILLNRLPTLRETHSDTTHTINCLRFYFISRANILRNDKVKTHRVNLRESENFSFIFGACDLCAFARPNTEYSHRGHCVHAIKTFGIRKFAQRIECRRLLVHVAAHTHNGPNKLLPFVRIALPRSTKLN